MEPDGFAYDGAAVYDLEQRTYLRIFGNYPDEAAQAQVTPPDLSGQPVTPRGRHHHQSGTGSRPMRSTLPFPMKNTRPFSRPIPEEKVYDPTAPVYHEGDTVYLENQEYQITETAGGYRTASSFRHGLPQSSGPKVGERFETLLREDARNEAITEFLAHQP